MIGNSKAFKAETEQKIKLDGKLLMPILLRRLVEEGIINSTTYANVIKEGECHEESLFKQA